MNDRIFRIYLLSGVFVSLCLSFWLYAYHPLINLDGFCYLAIAEAWPFYSLKDLRWVCPVGSDAPLYSFLIYAVDRLFSLHDLERSAWIINAFFSAGTWAFMMLLLRKLGAGARAQWIGGVVFLFFHEWMAVRQFIVRDHGYWFFYFASIFLFCLMMENRARKWIVYVLFFISAVLALLFRIEGAMILGLLPLFILFFSEAPWRKRMLHCFCFYLPIFILMLGVVLAGFFLADSFPTIGRLPDLYKRVVSWYQHVAGFYQDQLKFHQSYFVLHEPRYFIFNWTINSFFMIFVEIIKNVSVLNVLILAAGFRVIQSENVSFVKKILLYSAFLNVLMLTLTFFRDLYFSNRYVLALALTLLIFVPVILDAWISFLLEHRRWYARTLVSGIFLLCVVQVGMTLRSGLKRASEHQLMPEAAAWVKKSGMSWEDFYTNDARLFFYAYFAPNRYRAFQEFISYGDSSFISFRDQKKAFLFVGRSYKFLGLSEEASNRFLMWHWTGEIKDSRGRGVVLFSKNE